MEADGPRSPACGVAETVREAHPSNPPFPAAHPEELGRHILKMRFLPHPQTSSKAPRRIRLLARKIFLCLSRGGAVARDQFQAQGDPAALDSFLPAWPRPGKAPAPSTGSSCCNHREGWALSFIHPFIHSCNGIIRVKVRGIRVT